ncbi:hypothetical protein K466DRAFT_28348 [Polyporus arcularius HHB13444]|uniref:Uncharacterized protein n=1 Tax=Polyporus arcularius HHB13444 TaxID=1314778 RepID=A0A5C3PMB4_9APHY|nr:hypothetical protein K466DRAFT_28348 [Polyporus arcularius HHB13444]
MSVLDNNIRIALILAATATAIGTVATTWSRVRSRTAAGKSAIPDRAEQREKLPPSLSAWRVSEDESSTWDPLRAQFSEAGIELWGHDSLYQRANKEHVLLSSGFATI